MLVEDIYNGIPNNWCPMDCTTERYKLVPLPPYSEEYCQIEGIVGGTYLSYIRGIYRVQNPHLYSKFMLKAYEYEQRGPLSTFKLFHDTPSENTLSIIEYNFDWRYGERFKYGPGVYFSISPALANKHSRRTNSACRSMFCVDVLVQNIQFVEGEFFLPDFGHDTVVAHNRETFVKYFDSEFYPRYLVDYIARY